METRPFFEKTNEPNPQTLRDALGDSIALYEALIYLTARYSLALDWSHSKQSGWMLKVHDKKKALLYIIPLIGGFRVSLTLRESEREVLMQNSTLAALHADMEAAKKYSEGYALVFEIRDSGSYARLLALLEEIMRLRR